MRIASWNVNSIKVRLDAVLAWLKSSETDVLLLQEIKTVAEQFPRQAFADAGYECVVAGQKAYNGVAIASRLPLADVTTGLPGDDEDEQARYAEATVEGVRVASIYLPNGNPVDSPKFDYKLAWMRRLEVHAAALLAGEQPVVLGGDYNVIPQPVDAYEPAAWEGDALFRPESRAAFRRIEHIGYIDAFRALKPDAEHAFTFWDYQAGRWQRDQGIRIDHLLLSPEAADRLEACEIDRDPRGQPKASDHTPIYCDLGTPRTAAALV